MLRWLFIVLFYCLFSLIVISVSLVYLFPRGKLLSWSEQLIERQLPGVACKIGAVKYVHPLKLRLYEVVVRFKRYRVELPVETLLLSFQPDYPIKTIGVVGVLLGGDLKTDVVFASGGEVKLSNLEFSEMHLEDLTTLRQLLDRSLQGRLSFDGRASINRRSSVPFRLNGSLQVTNFKTELRRPIFAENDVSFGTLRADLSQQGKRLELSVGRAAGPLLAATFYGEIQGDRPWEQSTLSITGTLSPQPGLLEKRPELAARLRSIYQRYRLQSIPFVVDGTIIEPRFRFSELK